VSWLYEQSSGRFTDPTGTSQGKGYSGQPPFVNDATAQAQVDQGPIPQGLWQAVELIPESTSHGPYAIRLEPYQQTETFGRSGFMMHGDLISRPGYASEGCIVMSRDVRELFWNSTDHDILVVAEQETT
jgi:hypothetical protein